MKNVLERTKMFYIYIEIIQILNKMAIDTHAIFSPRNAMFCLSNTTVFLDWQQ